MIHFNASKILIPVDFSETSLLAIKHGAFIAKQEGARVHLLHIVNTHYSAQNLFLPVVTMDQGEIEGKASQKLNELADSVRAEHGIEIETSISVGSASNEISRYAKEKLITLIIMGTHGYSPIEELVIGSTALKVITKSPCPVMAMSIDATKNSYKKILIPIDNTVNSKQKVNFAIEMAKKFGASLHAVALLSDSEASEKGAMETVMHQIEELAKEKSVSFLSEIQLDVKNRATATVDFGNKIGADLTIIMTDQDAELSGFFLGPYSQQVIHLSKIPVIAIKPKDLFVDRTSILPGTGGYNF